MIGERHWTQAATQGIVIKREGKKKVVQKGCVTSILGLNP